MLDRGIASIEPTEVAEDEWVQTIIKLARLNEKFLESCTPGYYNNEAKPALRSLQNTNYGLGPVAFFKVLSDCRDEHQLSGLEVSYEKNASGISAPSSADGSCKLRPQKLNCVRIVQILRS